MRPATAPKETAAHANAVAHLRVGALCTRSSGEQLRVLRRQGRALAIQGIHLGPQRSTLALQGRNARSVGARARALSIQRCEGLVHGRRHAQRPPAAEGGAEPALAHG